MEISHVLTAMLAVNVICVIECACDFCKKHLFGREANSNILVLPSYVL